MKRQRDYVSVGCHWPQASACEPRRNAPGSSLICLANFASGLASATIAAGAEVPGPAGSLMIHLHDRDSFTGQLADSEATDRLLWKSPVFAGATGVSFACDPHGAFSGREQLPRPAG